MHRSFLLLFFISSLSAQTVVVGSGAPSNGVTVDFQNGFFRNNFFNLVNATPLANVAKFGSTGYYQEFNLLNITPAEKVALILPSLAVSGTQGAVLQVLGGMYTYYSALGVNTVGYPTTDTQTCPGLATCQYQPVTGNYALFYYASGNPNGNGFSITGNIFTEWTTLGGIYSALGTAYNAQATVTSPAKTTAIAQLFTDGMIVSPTSGVNSGSTYAVVGAVNTVYQAYGGVTGTLGLPTSNDLTLADGSHRQAFEGGNIVYTVGNTPVAQLAISQITITPVGSLSLQFGQTVTVTAALVDSVGVAAVGRVVSWATSNSSVVTITPSGYTVTLKAVGSGTAQITATSGGLVSAKLIVSVNSICCDIGQGAPTTAIQQAFQNAITRNHLTILLPAAASVRRVGAGYVQDLYSTDGTIHYLVAEPDSSATAYVVAGPALTAYTANGGPAGSLGYPSSDISSGGTQLFQGGALAGNPVQVVAGAILTKWAALQYEAGPAGVPTAAQLPFTSVSAYSGYSQSFASGVIFGIANGSLVGQAYFSSGLILARYLALSGPSGEMGVPLTDIVTTSGVARQNFENGYIDLQPGASAAVEHLLPRTPTITANPTSVLTGNRLHISISGFVNNAALRVSQSGQADFLVTAVNGAYSWDTYISSSAAAGSVTIKAVDTGGTATATGTYTVRSIDSAKPQLVKSQGDNQTGTPGVALPVPLTITLTDSSGTPLSGSTVSFAASPGASVSITAAVTDSGGHASTVLRLPPSAGVAAVTVQALGQLAIFDAQASGSIALVNFPAYSAATPAGSQVSAVAAMLRYYQNQAVMPAVNGPATVVAVDKYLASLGDGYLDSQQLVNLWRLTGFMGGNVFVSIESTSLATTRGFVAGGDPVLLSMALTQDGVVAGGATVVATGVATDGSVTILDPNPTFAQTNLSAYLNGFSANGHVYQGAIISAVRLLPQSSSTTGFVLESIAQPVVTVPLLAASSPARSCSAMLTVQDPYIGLAASSVVASQFVYCDGSQSLYQVSTAGSSPYQAALLDLATGGVFHDLSAAAAASYQVTRVSGMLTVSTPSISFTATSILNAASFTKGISPGGLISIFGTGLSAPASTTSISIGGQAASVLLATPFQINAQVPPGLTTGTQSMAITNVFGSLSQPLTLSASSPGIFTIGTATDGVSTLGTIFNQNGTMNNATAPASRGTTLVIYCTGLGATSLKANLQTTTTTVTASISGATPSAVAYAGLTPGFIGLYQVNFQIPTAIAPGLYLPLVINQGNSASNAVVVAVQ